MPYSCIIDGKVLDYHYKKSKVNDFQYNFYIGDIFVGQVFQINQHRWSAVSAMPNVYGVVEGFGSRFWASEYLLKVGGYHK